MSPSRRSARQVLVSASLASPWLLHGTWGRGILLCGLAALGEAGRVASALRAAPVGRRFPLAGVNAGPVHLAALAVPGAVADPGSVDEAIEFAHGLAGYGARRHASGALSHLQWADSVWSDTEWMTAPLLARAATLTGLRVLADEAVLQVLSHIEVLRDPSTGLVSHSLWPSARWLDDRAAWARGNGWVLDASARVIDELGPEKARPLVAPAVELARALAARQRPDGLWPAIMDGPPCWSPGGSPGGPGESSSAALVARAILALERLGLDVAELVSCAHRAARAVVACIDGSGLVRRSQGPVVWASLAPVGGIWPWTQGLAMLLLAEIRRTENPPACSAARARARAQVPASIPAGAAAHAGDVARTGDAAPACVAEDTPVSCATHPG